MKQLLKKIFVPSLSSKPISRLAKSLIGNGVPIFMLHRMAVEGQPNTGITPEHLRRCLQYLVDNDYNFISLEDVITALKNKTPLPNNAVAFTMDDGFSDQGSIAAPIFLEFNCPLTFFVITGLLDTTLWPWDAQVSWIINNTNKNALLVKLDDETVEIKLDKKNRHQAREQIRNLFKEVSSEAIPAMITLLTETAEVKLPVTAPQAFHPLSWESARQLENKGIRFAPHSMSHRILSKLNRTSVEEEIVGSWQILQKQLSNPLKVFCYPTGRVLDFGPREIELLKKENFIGAVATEPGYVDENNTSPDALYRLPRFELPGNMTDFIQYCSWIEHAKSKSLG